MHVDTDSSAGPGRGYRGGQEMGFTLMGKQKEKSREF